MLSILLSLAGIFGLVTLTIQQSTKEIGIRKVLGAGMLDIVKLTTRSYLLLIVIASVLAVPFAWYYMNRWLQDFIFSSLYEKIGPLIITNHPWQNRYDYLAVRYRSDSPASLLSQIKNSWQNTVIDAPFEYWFLDDAYNNLYKNEEQFHRIFFYFSMLSILLSLAGIFGLVTLTIQQSTKEIGIRKVLGAGILDIVKLTTRSYLLLIVVASVLAVPFAWYYMNRWLQDFEYRINLSWWMFVIAGIVTLIIALTTVTIQTLNAAKANPVKSLKTE